MTYAGRYGADTGGGFNEAGAIDPQNPGHALACGDTWGLRYTEDGGNEWMGSMAGMSVASTPAPHCRTGFFSKRVATSGLRFYGTGTNGGTGDFFYALPGELIPRHIDSNGFGLNLGGGGSGANATARRSCGKQIDSWLKAGDLEYIFTLTRSGLRMYANTSGASGLAAKAAAIPVGGVQLLCDTAAIGDKLRGSVCVLDSKNLIVTNWDHDTAMTPIATDIYLVTTSAADWSGATSGNTTATLKTLPGGIAQGRVYEVNQGKDGVFYAACGYDGVYTVARSGTSLNWTHISAPSGEFADLLVSSVDADSAGNVYAGQAAGNLAGSYANQSSGMVAGHSILKGDPTHASWSHPASGAAVKLTEFQTGDGATGTGRQWWLSAQNVVLSQPAHDVSMIRVDPNDDNVIYIWGRAGCWQSRDAGASWYPAMNGMNGGQTISGACVTPAGTKIRTTGPTSLVAYNDDYHQSASADGYATAARVSNCYASGAGGVNLSLTAATSYVGDDGATYVFTPPSGGSNGGGTPAKLTRNGVRIDDVKFQGAIITPVSMAVDAGGNVYIIQDGGGIFVQDASGGGGGGGGGGAGYTLPDTLIGPPHRFSSLHYEPGGIVGEGGNTALQNAQLYADLMDIIIGNVVENPATTAITTDKFQGQAAAMLVENPALLLMGYNKGPQIDEGASYFPTSYYAHVCPWPTGAKLTVFSPSIYIAQPTAPNQAAYTDPRGWTAHSFKEQRARDAWARLARYNTLAGAAVLRGAMFDSMGPSSFSNQCDPLTGKAYTKAAWLGQVHLIGSEAIARKPDPTYPVMGNGLSNGSSYFAAATPSSGLVAYVDLAWAESWLRGNFDAPTAFHTESAWQQDVSMVYDVSVVKGKGFLGTINLCNDTAGSGVCAFSDPQREQWRRYSLATYHLAKTSRSWVEFFQDTSVKPWREAHAYYDADLGDPIDTYVKQAGDSIAQAALFYKQAGGEYRRRFTEGVAYVNPTTASKTVTLDRDYVDPIDSTTHLAGSTFSLPANSGRVFTHNLAGPSGDPPVVIVTSPDEGSSSSIPGRHVTGTASSADGIALVEYAVDGGAFSPATGTTSWSFDVVLPSAGSHTITVRATDAAVDPQTTVHSFTLILVGPPTVVITSPPANVTTRMQTLTAKVDSPIGIATVQYQTGTGAYATLPHTSGDQYSTSINLPAKKGQTISTPVRVRATDTDGKQTVAALEVAVTLPFH